MKHGSFAIILGILTAASLFAEKTWEGSAAVGRYGEFPPTGFYGASNSFPRNSIVDVTNLASGKSTRVIITGGLSDPSMFLVVSEQAAEILSIARNDAIRVRVSPVVIPGTEPLSPGQDLPYSPDPDVNPSARVGDANEAVNPRKNAGSAGSSPVVEKKAVLPAEPVSPVKAQAAAKEPVEAIAQAAVPLKEDSGIAPKPEASARIADKIEPSAVKAEVPKTAVETEDKTGPAPVEIVEIKEMPAEGPKADPALPQAAIALSDKDRAAADDWAKPAPVNQIEEAGLLAANRMPQKNLFPPPRESESFLLVEEPKAPADTAVKTEAPAEKPEAALAKKAPAEEELKASSEPEPVKPVVSGEVKVELEPAEMKPPALPSPDIALKAEQAEIAEPKKADTEAAAKEALEKLDTIIAAISEEKPEEEKAKEPEGDLEAEEKPPLAKDVARKPEPEDSPHGDEWAKKNLPLTASLVKDSYYLQVAACGNPKNAKPVVDALGPYPVVVLSTAGEKPLYRVLVGPVKEDEKGLLLFKVRAQGYKDAFVRKGE